MSNHRVQCACKFWNTFSFCTNNISSGRKESTVFSFSKSWHVFCFLAVNFDDIPVNLEVERPVVVSRVEAARRFLHVTLFHGKQRSIMLRYIPIPTRRGDDDGDDDGRGFIADAAKYRAKCLGLGFYSRSSI